MRKKMLFMILALATTAGALTPRTEAAQSGYSCPACTTYPDGSSCCVSCWCNGQGVPVWCTDNFCPEEP
jgi:hypothetical protein